ARSDALPRTRGCSPAGTDATTEPATGGRAGSAFEFLDHDQIALGRAPGELQRGLIFLGVVAGHRGLDRREPRHHIARAVAAFQLHMPARPRKEVPAVA